MQITVVICQGLANNSHSAYVSTAVFGSIIGVVVGQFDVHYIIKVALPALMFIYPITIVLIVLNALPTHWASSYVFRTVTILTLVFSIPDFLQFFVTEGSLDPIKNWIPFSKQSLGWVLPAFISFCVVNGIQNVKKER